MEMNRGEKNVFGEKGKNRERTENANQSGCDCRHGGRLRNDEPRPAVEESAQWAVSNSDIDVFAAGLRFHRTEFGVSESSEEGGQTTHQPGQIHQLGRAYGLHHL